MGHGSLSKGFCSIPSWDRLLHRAGRAGCVCRWRRASRIPSHALLPRSPGGPLGSLGIQCCSAPPPSPRQHRGTCIALPFALLPIPHQARPAACLLHLTYKTSQGQCPTDWAGTDTASCCHIQLTTDIDGQGYQLPGPSPHARDGGTKAGADGCTAALGTLLLLSRVIFCRPSLRRLGHKAPPVRPQGAEEKLTPDSSPGASPLLPGQRGKWEVASLPLLRGLPPSGVPRASQGVLSRPRLAFACVACSDTCESASAAWKSPSPTSYCRLLSISTCPVLCLGPSDLIPTVEFIIGVKRNWV